MVGSRLGCPDLCFGFRGVLFHGTRMWDVESLTVTYPRMSLRSLRSIRSPALLARREGTIATSRAERTRDAQ
jgi:hypothetical protein